MQENHAGLRRCQGPTFVSSFRAGKPGASHAPLLLQATTYFYVEEKKIRPNKTPKLAFLMTRRT